MGDSMKTSINAARSLADARIKRQRETLKTPTVPPVQAFFRKKHISKTPVKTSETTKVTAENVSVGVNEQPQALSDIEEEVAYILATSTLPLEERIVPETHIWDCLSKNGSIHYTQYGNILFSFTAKNQEDVNGHSLTCWIRWIAKGIPGKSNPLTIVFRILYRECSTTDDTISVYQLNATDKHKPKIKELVKICSGTMHVEYDTETNEILILVKMKNPASFDKFVLEFTSRPALPLEIHQLSKQGGNRCHTN